MTTRFAALSVALALLGNEYTHASIKAPIEQSSSLVTAGPSFKVPPTFTAAGSDDLSIVQAFLRTNVESNFTDWRIFVPEFETQFSPAGNPIAKFWENAHNLKLKANREDLLIKFVEAFIKEADEYDEGEAGEAEEEF
jgi:hypothetical protein